MSNDCESAISNTGWGPCHYFIVGLCGMCSLAEAGASLIVLIVAPLLACDFKLNRSQASALNATSSFGMAVGAFLFGTMSDTSGRKGSIPVTMAIAFCGSIVLSFAQTRFLINLSIFVLGAGLAGNNVVLRVYLIECLPIKRRGTCLAILDIFWVIGYLSALGISSLLLPSVVRAQGRKFRPVSWRVLAGLGGAPCIVMTCMVSLLPPSPRHLLYRRKREVALAVLQQMYAINNSKHADTYPESTLDNGVRPEDVDDDYRRGCVVTAQKFFTKTIRRVEELCSGRYKFTTILGMIICLLQFPGFIWLAFWNAWILREMDRERSIKLLDSNSTCFVDVDEMATAFLRNCREVDTEYVVLLLPLSLSYVLGEVVLHAKGDVIRRKIFLLSSGILGAITSVSLIFVGHRTIKIVLSSIILACFAIGRTSTTILLLENYPTRLRGTIIGLTRIFPYLVESCAKLTLHVHCLPTIVTISGLLAGTAIAGLPLPDLTWAPMQE